MQGIAVTLVIRSRHMDSNVEVYWIDFLFQRNTNIASHKGTLRRATKQMDKPTLPLTYYFVATQLIITHISKSITYPNHLVIYELFRIRNL